MSDRARDPRVTLARPDLAAASLEGVVAAERYAETEALVTCVPVAPISAGPDGTAAMTSQLLFGERFDVCEATEHWAWGQSALDGYVGYVPRACLDLPGAAGAPEPTHRVAAPQTHVYPAADFKARVAALLPYGARVAVTGEDGAGQVAFSQLAGGGYVPSGHLAPLADPSPDWVAEAERLAGVPYLWGGRSAMGIDCSGLLQVALQAAGHHCPRDSDQQGAALGRALGADDRLCRGDLVFWADHVGVMTDDQGLLHANIHHMGVALEPLEEAAARIAAKGGGEITGRRRLDAGPRGR